MAGRIGSVQKAQDGQGYGFLYDEQDRACVDPLRADATAQHLSKFASHRTSMPRSLGFKAKQAGRPRPIRVVEVRFG
jgi:hypothetical protein